MSDSGDEQRARATLDGQTFAGVKNDFESSFAKAFCANDHRNSPVIPKGDIYEVITYFRACEDGIDFEDTISVCAEEEIAVAEAVHEIYEEGPWGHLFETQNIFSDSVFKLAYLEGKVQELNEMRRRLRNALVCTSCYNRRYDEDVDCNDSNGQILVRPVSILTKKRKFSR
jgi:hypothetical protein